MRNIGIIGAGNLGTHVCKLIQRNQWSHFLTVSDKDFETAERLVDELKDDAWVGYKKETIQVSDIIFLTVKPDQIKSVCEEISRYGSTINPNQQKIIVSMAAGIQSTQIRNFLHDNDNSKYKIVRCMPNLPILKGVGSMIWYSKDIKSYESERNVLNLILYGPTSYWTEKEELVDAATVLIGSGPAYMANFFKIYFDLFEKMGFNTYQAEILTKSLANGTLSLWNDISLEDIMKQVSSKGGITEKGLEELQANNFDNIIKTTMYNSLEQIEKIKDLHD